MLSEIQEMHNSDDFISAAAKLTRSANRAALLVDIRDSGLTLLSADMWDTPMLDEAAKQITADSFPECSEGVAYNVKQRVETVRRLQLLAHCNEGISKPMQGFFDRVCL